MSRRLLLIIINLGQIIYTSKCASFSYPGATVFPEIIEGRDDSATKLIKINEDITLRLEKSSLLAKEFLLRTYDGHILRHNYLDGELLEENLYHEPRSFSSVILSQENGLLQVEGVLGTKLRIKPSLEQSRAAKGSVAHTLYEMATDTDSANERTAMHPLFNISERLESQDNASAVVRPELLIAVDSTFASQFKDYLQLLRYVVISVNSVNVRYMTVRNPRVLLKLCAVEVFTEYSETFLYKVGSYVASVKSLERFREYVASYAYRYMEYDLLHFVTGLDVARFTPHGWDATAQGSAYVGGACTSRKVALGEHKAFTYKGVRICAHELGHLLGCPHDGQRHMEFNSEACPWDDGFIMSYSERNSRSLKFSSCCKNMIIQHARSEAGACLYTMNTRRKLKKANFTSHLPGDDVGRDQFCKLTFPESPGSYVLQDEGIGRCHVRCYVNDHVGYRKVFLPDNSWCNESGGRVCINGDCVATKPNYIQYRPTR